MRKAVFLLLPVLMVYVAGIYGSTPLMVLAAAETVPDGKTDGQGPCPFRIRSEGRDFLF